MPREHDGAWPYTLSTDARTAVTARECSKFGSGGPTSTIRVVCRSPNTGGKPLRSMKCRSDEYTSRTGVGITPSTPRTIVDRRTADDSEG